MSPAEISDIYLKSTDKSFDTEQIAILEMHFCAHPLSTTYSPPPLLQSPAALVHMWQKHSPADGPAPYLMPWGERNPERCGARV